MMESRNKPAPDRKEPESDNMHALWVKLVLRFPRYPTITLMIPVAEIAVTQQDTLNPTLRSAAWVSLSESWGDAAILDKPVSLCWFFS
ncbi:hypothetical protein MRB53_020673 [Persea americana]|uniref:Uncharacterized protein n=1 Tax=Persea americana TaxID=3435 RepID=A0ACC2L2G8_PERAE|nr:hypothetical protein MRB53_020673 [Persea americana]